MDPRAPWQKELALCITDPHKLIETLDLPAHWAEKAIAAHPAFTLKVPLSFVKRMKKGDPKDPLLLQILPLSQELHDTDGYTTDPLAEKQHNPLPGVLHKYANRILVTATGSCSINCRYCFRRHFPYADNRVNTAYWDRIINYLEQAPHINEVILSGGEPLLLKDPQIHSLWERISQVPSIKRIRIHTRMPIALPQRITETLVSALLSTHVKPIVAIHCNHPQEIDTDVGLALGELHQAGITLLNQTVLLKGINDCEKILISLSEKLFDNHTMPYYLHALDAVQNAAHFDVPLSRAKTIHHAMKAQLPGFLVPKLVKEQPHQPSKTWV